MAFITDPQLKQAVAASQGAAGPEALPPHWLQAVPRANRQAYTTLRSLLYGRGFTPAQVAAWGLEDDGKDWNERLGVCAACRDVSKSSEDRGEAFRREWKELLEEFKAFSIVIAGEIVNPTGSGTRVGYGDFDTGDDLHLIDDTL